MKKGNMKHKKFATAVLVSLGGFAVGVGMTNTAYAALKDEDSGVQKPAIASTATPAASTAASLITSVDTAPRGSPGGIPGVAGAPPNLTPEQAADLLRRIREAQEVRKVGPTPIVPQSISATPAGPQAAPVAQAGLHQLTGMPQTMSGAPAPVSITPAAAPALSTLFGSAQPALSQIGLPPETQKEIKGFSRGSPLMVVLKQIVPAGWTAKKEGSLDVNQDVSWQGNRTWVEILGSLATKYNFTAVIDWGRREVKITSGTLGNESLIEVAQLPQSTQSPLLHQVVHQVVAAPAKSREWLLSNKTSLKENVEAWSKRAGWSVAWNGEDYPVDVSTILSGDFEADNGPIAQLAVAYRSAKQPLIFRMMEGNKTLVVQNQEYEQRMFQENYRPQQQR